MAASEVARGGGGLGTGAAGGAAEVQPDFSELNGVQIAVRAAVGGDAPGEWTMVELQGTVETGKAPLPGLEVGELTILPGDKATLQIGRQMLDGSLVSLKKPQAVLSKGFSADGSTCYTVVGVIRRKASFTSRPNPVKQTVAAAGSGSAQTLRENRLKPQAADAGSKRPRAAEIADLGREDVSDAV